MQAVHRGQYLDEVAQTSCKTCRAGTYSSTRGRSTSCLECPPGTHLVDQNTPTSHDNKTDCKECPVLTYNPFEGHGDACFQCPRPGCKGPRHAPVVIQDNTKIKARVETLHVSSANEASTGYETKTLVCHASGSYANNGMSICTLCPRGRHCTDTVLL